MTDINSADRAPIGHGLQRALEQGEFVVQLQPIVALPTRRITGFETLVRWEHPIRGLLMPGAFLPAAEHLGVIGAIDQIVLDETIRLLARHASARPIAVNLAGASFRDAALVTRLADLLQAADVAPHRLVIEVTEAVLMADIDAAAEQIQALRRLGVAVLIDDIGVGPWPMLDLRGLAVDGVKIDRSFIARLSDPRATALVATVFDQAAALDLTVVAEGIETDEQVDRLAAIRARSADVHLTGQGHLFGRPADADVRLGGFVEVPMDLAAG